MSDFTISELEGILVVDSRLIADQLGIQHQSLLSTIETYKTDIEQAFGQCRFEVEAVRNSVGAVNNVKYALLTEDQAVFLMTLSRNTQQVVQCKNSIS